MRLSKFILGNTESILADFEEFARTIVPDGSMDIAALRDHAQEILTVIAHDLETPQTARQAKEKAAGRSDADSTVDDTPAQEHGSGRATSGFTIGEMVSEYRALRASVIRLWTAECDQFMPTDIDDLVRFSESIDQALAESTSRFAADLDSTRDTFIGILGHDLRSPLGAIITSGQFMLAELAMPDTARTLTNGIVNSGLRMNAMVDDLLDFTRTRLGVSIPVKPEPLDLADVIRSGVEEIMASKPETIVSLDITGNLAGSWDDARLRQVLSNLLGNAISHGSAGTPITVAAQGDADTVTFVVHNHGPAIPKNLQAQIFNPLSSSAEASRNAEHLGLGLYIAEQIVIGHCGTIEVESTAALGTTFTVRLPRTST